MLKSLAITMVSVLTLWGLAGEADATATIDLIWLDVSNVGANGKPICLRPLQRNCPQLGTTLNNVAATDNITLGVIVTAGAGGVIGVGVSVNYSDVLPAFGVIDFRSMTTMSQNGWWLSQSFGNDAPSDIPPFIDSINALTLTILNSGIGLPAGQSAYLGTVSFHKSQILNGTFEVSVGAFGPGGTDGIGNLDHQIITSTTTFNSAFVVPEPNALAALGSGIAALALLERRRRPSASR
jgi:hypothetical protein